MSGMVLKVVNPPKMATGCHFDVEASVAKLNKIARQIEGKMREACEELVRLRDNTPHGEFRRVISAAGFTFGRRMAFMMLRCADENLLDVVEQHGIEKARLVAYAPLDLRKKLLARVGAGVSKRELASMIPRKTGPAVAAVDPAPPVSATVVNAEVVDEDDDSGDDPGDDDNDPFDRFCRLKNDFDSWSEGVLKLAEEGVLGEEHKSVVISDLEELVLLLKGEIKRVYY